MQNKSIQELLQSLKEEVNILAEKDNRLAEEFLRQLRKEYENNSDT